MRRCFDYHFYADENENKRPVIPDMEMEEVHPVQQHPGPDKYENDSPHESGAMPALDDIGEAEQNENSRPVTHVVA